MEDARPHRGLIRADDDRGLSRRPFLHLAEDQSDALIVRELVEGAHQDPRQLLALDGLVRPRRRALGLLPQALQGGALRLIPRSTWSRRPM